MLPLDCMCFTNERPESSSSSMWLPGYFRLPEDLLDLPAFESAIAIACFCGLPAAISVLMLELTVFLELPDLSGMCLPVVNPLRDRGPPRLGFRSGPPAGGPLLTNQLTCLP